MIKFFYVLLCCITITLHTSELKKQLTILPHCTDLLIGGLSGAASMAMYAPWSYFQNRSIQKLPIEWKRPHHWFRGYRTLALNNAPVIAIQAASYNYITKTIKLRNVTNDLSRTDTTIAATIAGGISGPINNTTQLIVLHQQNTGLSAIQTINSLPNAYKSLHRAMLPATYRGMLFANSYINCLPHIEEYTYKRSNNFLISLVASALLSSILVTLTTQPIQVIITTLHADIEKKEYHGSWEVIKKIVTKNGVRALYTGACYRTIGNILALPVLKYVQKTLNDLKQDN